MKELDASRFKPIPGYEGLYECNPSGIIRSLDRVVTHKNGRRQRIQGQIITAYSDSAGYLHVTLCKNGKQRTVGLHRVIAETFVPNPNNKPAVNHIDGDKTNNCVDNLEWNTAQENMQHATRTGLLNPEQCRINGRKSIDAVGMRVKCEDTGELFPSIHEACKRVSDGGVSNNIHQGKRSHGGRGWLFTVVSEEYYQAHKDDPLDSAKCASIHAAIRQRIKNQGKAIKIYCVERDITYPSRLAAAKDNNMDTETINLAIKENRKAKGLTFKIVE